MSVRTTRREKGMRVLTLDGPFGPMQLRHDRWPTVLAEVQAPGMPTVGIVPDREHSAMTVNGQRASLSGPSRWQLRRASRTRRATALGRSYELRPTGLRTSRLLRDGLPIADARGTVAAYSPLRRIPGIDARLTWHDGTDHTDVAIGQAMVLGLGAGAPGLILGLIYALFDHFT